MSVRIRDDDDNHYIIDARNCILINGYDAWYQKCISTKNNGDNSDYLYNYQYTKNSPYHVNHLILYKKVKKITQPAKNIPYITVDDGYLILERVKSTLNFEITNGYIKYLRVDQFDMKNSFGDIEKISYNCIKIISSMLVTSPGLDLKDLDLEEEYYVKDDDLNKSVFGEIIPSMELIKDIDLKEEYYIDATKNENIDKTMITNIKENTGYNLNISNNNVLIPYNQNNSNDSKLIRSKLNELLNDTYGNIISN